MRGPDALRTLSVSVSSALAEVEGKLFVVSLLLVAFLVQFRDEGDELQTGGGFEVVWPVIANTVEKVEEPLASYII